MEYKDFQKLGGQMIHLFWVRHHELIGVSSDNSKIQARREFNRYINACRIAGDESSIPLLYIQWLNESYKSSKDFNTS